MDAENLTAEKPTDETDGVTCLVVRRDRDILGVSESQSAMTGMLTHAASWMACASTCELVTAFPQNLVSAHLKIKSLHLPNRVLLFRTRRASLLTSTHFLLSKERRSNMHRFKSGFLRIVTILHSNIGILFYFNLILLNL